MALFTIGIDHIVLTVHSIERTCAFYSNALGVEAVAFGDARRALQIGRQKINLHEAGHEFEPKALRPTPGSGDVCFVTDEPLDDVIARLGRLGISIEEGPVARTGAVGPLRSVYVRDPDDNLVEIANQVDPETESRPAQAASLPSPEPTRAMSIRRFYDRWPQYNRRLAEVVGAMTEEQLAIRPSPERWPIWATVGHTVSARVYWLCGIVGEPGADHTPWPDPIHDEGWEDDLDHPRRAAELVAAIDSTWTIVDGCLERWTSEMLDDEVERVHGDARQVHSRSSILQRLLTHEAYHCGELSQTLGIAGLPQIDLWRPD